MQRYAVRRGNVNPPTTCESCWTKEISDRRLSGKYEVDFGSQHLVMYGPPANCKKNRLRREQSAKMYQASKWRVISGRMMMIRACLSLLIATVVKDLVTSQVFRHAIRLCFRLLYTLSLADFLRSEFQ